MVEYSNKGGVNMDKISINDFPSLDGVSLVPTKNCHFELLEVKMRLYKK